MQRTNFTFFRTVKISGTSTLSIKFGLLLTSSFQFEMSAIAGFILLQRFASWPSCAACRNGQAAQWTTRRCRKVEEEKRPQRYSVDPEYRAAETVCESISISSSNHSLITIQPSDTPV